MSTNDGGPAYPVTQWNNDSASREIMGGMSLRDHFAGLAMQAHIGLEIYAKGELMPHEVAEHAYEMADAMLRAREASQ